MNKARNHDLVVELQQERNSECNASGQNNEHDFVCKGCKTRFESFVDQVNHSCHPHRCTLCKKLFQGSYELRLHKKMAHRKSTRENNTLNISLTSSPKQETGYVLTAARKYACKICDRPLKKKQSHCKNCLMIINREGEYNLRDKSDSAMIFSPDNTTTAEDTSGQLLRKSNGCSDNSEVLVIKADIVNTKYSTNTTITLLEEASEKEDTVTEAKPNKNMPDKTSAQNVRLEKLKSQRGQDNSIAESKLTRKRRLDSDDGNSMLTSKSNLQFAEGHTRCHMAKKIRNNGYSDDSELLVAKADIVNSKDSTNTTITLLEEASEKEDKVTEAKPNNNMPDKTSARNVGLEKLKSQRGQDDSIAGSKLPRKRRLDSADGNSMLTSKSNLEFAEGHTRCRTAQKVRNNSPVSTVTKSDMVQIDTLIRSLPDDCGILIKPCSDDSSILRCPKCSKMFRNLTLGSAHYSLCQKNIESSRNRKTLISFRDVVWVCSLCHVSFTHLSHLTQHKNSCLTTESSKALRYSDQGFESDSVIRICPKCCFECVSLIRYQDHSCETILEQYNLVTVQLKRIKEFPEDYCGSYIYFECACKEIFHSRHLINQHLQLHPHATTRDCVRTLYIGRSNISPVLSVIKTEVVSPNDEDCPNDFQNTSIAPSLQPTDPLCHKSRKEKKHSMHVPRKQQAQESIPAAQIGPNNTHSPNQRHSITMKTTEKELASSANSNGEQNFMNRDRCTCKPATSNEDVKPCLKCLSEMFGQTAMNDPISDADYAKLSKEVQEVIQDVDFNNEEEEPLETENESPDSLNPTELDLGQTLGYENSDVAMQLIQDLHANPTPSPLNHRCLTPPATPDSSNVHSPSHCPASKESCISSTKHGNRAGPSSVNQSPNDLASISLETLFTDSSEFIASLNETAPFETQTQVFPPFQSQAELPLSLQPPTEASLSFQPKTEAPLPFQPQVEPLLPFQSQAAPSVPFQPQAGPSLLFRPQDESLPSFPPQAEPSLQFQPQDEPSPQFQSQAETTLLFQQQAETSLPFPPSTEEALPLVERTAEREKPTPVPPKPLVERTAEREKPTPVPPKPLVERTAEKEEPTPVPPNIRHISERRRGETPELVIPDAFAVTDSNNGTVRRYLCQYCMLDFQIGSILDHLRTEHGKKSSKEVIAFYVCEAK